MAALVRWPEFSLEGVLQKSEPLILGAMGIQDPGNLGTIIRSAEAFGANAVLLGEKTVSEFNPKVIRVVGGIEFSAADRTCRLRTNETPEAAGSADCGDVIS